MNAALREFLFVLSAPVWFPLALVVIFVLVPLMWACSKAVDNLAPEEAREDFIFWTALVSEWLGD